VEYLSEAADVWAIYQLGRAALHENAGQKEGTGCSGLVEARQLLYGEVLEAGGGADDEGREPVCQQRVGYLFKKAFMGLLKDSGCGACRC
jgi:hypothetical protein